MATYMELFATKEDSDLQDKVAVAVVVAADTIRTDVPGPANQVQRLAWAAAVMQNPKTEAARMLWAVLAANKDNTVAQITGATDAAIQTAVDDAVDLFAGS
jgi:hypothetical protein